jgi:hypothetical protein
MNVQPFSAPNGRKRAGVKRYDVEGETWFGVGVSGRANVRYAVHRQGVFSIANGDSDLIKVRFAALSRT